MNNELNNDAPEEILMHLRPQTADEKLIWSSHHVSKLQEQNRQLAVKIGVLESELAELRYEMKTNEKDALILKNRNLKLQIKDKENRIKDLKQTNEQLLDKVIRLQINK